MSRSAEAAEEVKEVKVGCEFCPRNNAPGINKIMGTVTGTKDIMIWAQSPGPDENKARKELVGKSGIWLWNELKRIGINREDCDIQNVLRCWPTDKDEMGYERMRDPTKEELKCCSIYNKEAVANQKAKIWLVFGRIAREQLFRTKPKANVFYHKGIRVFLLDHPAYFVRGFAKERLVQFRELLDMVRVTLDNKDKARFHMYEDIRNCKIITSAKEARWAAEKILAIGRTGERIAYDEEDDTIDGVHKLLCLGACTKPGEVYVFVLDHPGNTASTQDKEGVRQVVRDLLTDPHPKVLQHGNYDDGTLHKLLGVVMQGYTFDVQYGEFFYDSTKKRYNLTDMVARTFPKYTGYKELCQDAVPEGLSVEEGREIGDFHLARVPLKKLAYYNGMDCHVTKMFEERVRDHVSAPLVRIYTEAAYTLDRMEKFGPLLDHQFSEHLGQIYPRQQQYFCNELRRLADSTELNPNSHPQIRKLIYNQWHIAPITNPPNTQKETLELLQQTVDHPGLKTLQDYRKAKTERERLEAFERSAAAHSGRVTTIFWLTGTRTGRLSSGGGQRVDKRNLGNLQNIPKRGALIGHALISDLRWRDWYRAATMRGECRKNSEGKEVWVLPNVLRACIDYKELDWFVVCDFSQMELRVLALTCGEEAMLEMFRAGLDIHAAIGSLWSGWSIEELKEESPRRTLVKTFHFGIIYGLTPKGLYLDLRAQGITTSEEECKEHYNKYFNRFKQVAQYKEDQADFAEKHGYVVNLFGFKVPIDVSGEDDKRGFWRNVAVNAPIQGAAHQVLLVALALLKRYPEKYKLIRPQMEIHDALVNVSPFHSIKETVTLLQNLLERDTLEVIKKELKVNWSVPLKADAKIGVTFEGLAKYQGDMKASIQGAVEKIKASEAKIQHLQTHYSHVTLDNNISLE